ncbi:MAG: UDP-glucose 4-epimerase GalE [Roseitalea porphyridii]|uniref:UDP-glucose 4-epimerase GalE n=1 Tax=Roseitalea porphyridii TaxID=1852022 RepID=UPI0032D945B1
MKILVTGGAGYIGSHTWIALREAGHTPVIVDNFANASPRVLSRLGQLFQTEPVCIAGDIRNATLIERVIEDHGCEAVIHFAGYKAVSESMAEPLKYFEVNVGGTERLLTAMANTGVRKLIFSSSATVYGDPECLPIPEDHRLSTASVYGQTKLIVEDMLRALHASDPQWAIAILRYFNPVGAHPSGLIGEDPADTPNNLMPFIAQVAVGRRPHLNVFGNDYPTPDGTGVRDYIHVCDLAEGHVAALSLLDEPQCTALNLGTGKGYSVLEMVEAFERASGRHVPYRIADRRPGDIASCYADPARAEALMGWRAERGLDEMCADVWRWQSQNPLGYLDVAAE